MREQARLLDVFLPPTPHLVAYIENPFEQSVVSHPFPEWKKVSNDVRAGVTLMGTAARPLVQRPSSPMGSGQHEQWQSRTIRAKISTDCVMSLTVFHKCVGKTRSTVLLKQNNCLSSLHT